MRTLYHVPVNFEKIDWSTPRYSVVEFSKMLSAYADGYEYSLAYGAKRLDFR